MRFMMLMIPKGYETADADAMPDAKAVAKMMQYNKSMEEAGVLLSLDGLHPPVAGVRVTFFNGRPEVVNGPFPGVNEALGGYWMIRVKSQEEAVSWAKRCPASQNETIEVRQVQELSDFPEDVRVAASGFSEKRKPSKKRRASHQPL